MKKCLSIAVMTMITLCTTAQRVMTDSAWRAEVKTVLLTREGVELERPVLTLGAGERMLLHFDLLVDEAQNLCYSIAHCDALCDVINTPPSATHWRRRSTNCFEKFL